MSHPALDGTFASSESQRASRPGTENSGLPMLLTPAEAARQLSLSRYTVYSELRTGRLRGRRYGRVILIPRGELERFADSLEQPGVYGTPLRSQVLTAALTYAARGWPVFAVRGKVPYTGTRGHLDANTDPARITAMFNARPDANAAIATGRGLLVLDVDPERGGGGSLDALERGHGELPATYTVETGGGGRHLYFSLPPEVEIRNSAGKLGPGLDVRGDGGYVVAAPSTTRGAYKVLEDHPLAPAPDWLLEALREPQRGRSKGGPQARRHRTGVAIREGVRNSTLTSIAGRLHDNTRDIVTLTGELLDVNAARCTPPLPDSEVERIARSVYTRTPCKRVFQPSPEVLDFVESHRSQVLHGRGWRGRSGPTDHDGYEAILDLAADHGRMGRSGGVHVRVSVRDFALRMGTTYRTAWKCLQRLQHQRLLYRNPRMTNGVAGEIVLREVATQECISQPTRLGIPSTDIPLRTLLRRTRYGAGRLGKLAELALRAVLLGGGESTTAAVAANLERRGCDVRRTLRKLVARGVLVECSGGDRFRVARDLAAEYARVLDEDGVPERERRQRADDERLREAYRNRHQVKPDRVPEKPPAGEIAELERVPDADHELVDALAEWKRHNPHRTTENPSWLAVAVWADMDLPFKPTPQQVEVAMLDVPEREGVAA